MYRGKSIAVVVPAYNEEGFVGDVIDGIPGFVDRLYVVDDRSTDGTWAEVRRHVRRANDRRGSRETENAEPTAPATAGATATGRTNSTAVGEADSPADGRANEEHADGGGAGVGSRESNGTGVPDGGDGADRWAHAVRHGANRGVGAAIKTGYRLAARDGVDVTAVMNGDGQMDPAILDRIVHPVATGAADYAKGDRLLDRDHRAGMTSWRFLGNAALSLLTKVASGYWQVQDSQNGYTAISADAIATLDLDAVYDDYGFLNDVLVHLNAHSMTVADVRMQAVYRDEESSIGYAEFIPRVSRLLLGRFLWRLRTKYVVREFHPLVFLYPIGVAGGVASAALFAWVVVAVATAAAPATATVTVAGVACAVGLVAAWFVVAAMVCDAVHNERLQRRELR
ncbi:glycosyltransferase family 2 protein (plasmid) [Halobaculum sp. CBA1158]|uniref:glycosyltransferase family 2 protein n=1 Tax=Halobaculum sp. CBA1158 TaxID=2904243 RepID=UPI001F18E1E0|nr:glycosyltransferase family 2 protein [Halobaculum sp. CBA1158]UIP01468.1 glycosyltransferase family 2 protein [Halobaculum sp. CBA1158]